MHLQFRGFFRFELKLTFHFLGLYLSINIEICAKFGLNWPSRFRECCNVKSLQTDVQQTYGQTDRQTINKRRTDRQTNNGKKCDQKSSPEIPPPPSPTGSNSYVM